MITQALLDAHIGNEPGWSYNKCKTCRLAFTKHELDPSACTDFFPSVLQCSADSKNCLNCQQQKSWCDSQTNGGCGNFSPKRCEQPAREGFLVCRFHGSGKKDGPSAGRKPITGKYADLGRVSEIIEELAQDPQLLNLEQEIAIRVMMNRDILELYQEGGVAPLSDAWKDIRDGINAIQAGAIDSGLSLILDAVNATERDAELRVELDTGLTVKSQLDDKQRKMVQTMHTVFTVNNLQAIQARMITALLDTINEDPRLERDDPRIVAAFIARLESSVPELPGGTT